MVDPRFYVALGPLPVRDLAMGGEVFGDPERLISGVAPAQTAGPHDLAWVEGKAADVSASRAGALFVRAERASSRHSDTCALVVAQPRGAFAQASARLFRERAFGRVAIDPSAFVEEGAEIAPGAVIGPDARIGAGAVIGPNAVIGPGVAIGRRSRIGAHASVTCALIGDDVTILPGVRIGQTGFAVAAGAGAPKPLPHFGRVVIMDRASIGSNTTIDRGLFDDTTIGEDAQIDNLCQIAHNVVVGRGVIIAACAGVSGSTVIEDGAMLGGRVGVADHRRLGRGAMLAAGSAVMHDVPAGETWGGYPAKPIRKWLREVAWLGRAAGRRDDGA